MIKSQVLHTAWCNISGEAAGEIWHWSLLGVKGLILYSVFLGRFQWANMWTVPPFYWARLFWCWYYLNIIIPTLIMLQEFQTVTPTCTMLGSLQGSGNMSTYPSLRPNPHHIPTRTLNLTQGRVGTSLETWIDPHVVYNTILSLIH